MYHHLSNILPLAKHRQGYYTDSKMDRAHIMHEEYEKFVGFTTSLAK